MFPGGAPACERRCAQDGLHATAFVYTGEYSTACVCGEDATTTAASEPRPQHPDLSHGAPEPPASEGEASNTPSVSAAPNESEADPSVTAAIAAARASKSTAPTPPPATRSRGTSELGAGRGRPQSAGR